MEKKNELIENLLNQKFKGWLRNKTTPSGIAGFCNKCEDECYDYCASCTKLCLTCSSCDDLCVIKNCAGECFSECEG